MSKQVRMHICSECGRQVAPKAYLEKLKKKVNLREELLELCPACRRKRMRIFSGEHANTD